MTDNTERELFAALFETYSDPLDRDYIARRAGWFSWQARAARSAALDAPTDEEIMREARAYFDVMQEPDRKALYSGTEEVVIAVVRASMGYLGDAQREQDRLDAERYRWLRDTMARSVGGGVEVNDARLVYEDAESGEEVRVFWYPDTPVGFYESHGSTICQAIDAAIAQAKPATFEHGGVTVINTGAKV